MLKWAPKTGPRAKAYQWSNCTLPRAFFLPLGQRQRPLSPIHLPRHPLAQHPCMLRQRNLRLLDISGRHFFSHSAQTKPLYPPGRRSGLKSRRQVHLALAHQLQLPASVLPPLGVLHVHVRQPRADEIPRILDRLAHPVGVMHVPHRLDVGRVHLPQHARHLLPPQNESCVSRQLVTPCRSASDPACARRGLWCHS